MATLAVELCGRLADGQGPVASVDIPHEGCSAATLLALASGDHPVLSLLVAEGRVKVCVNEAIVAVDARVHPGDRVALFPPVSGG